MQLPLLNLPEATEQPLNTAPKRKGGGSLSSMHFDVLSYQSDVCGVVETVLTPSSPSAPVRPDALLREDVVSQRVRETLVSACDGASSVSLYLEHGALRRRYRVVVGVDLFGWLVVERYWGSLSSKRGGRKVNLFAPDEQSRGLAKKMMLRLLATRKRNGYAVLGFAGLD